MLQKYKTSIIYGHTHKLQRFYQSGLKTQIEAISAGWLGDKSQVAGDYINDVADWQQGLVAGHVSKNAFHLETVSIKNRGGFFYGDYYSA
jgi:hypothetical protein